MASSDTLREQVATALNDYESDPANAPVWPPTVESTKARADAAIGVVLAAVRQRIEALPLYDNDGDQHACGEWLRESDVLEAVSDGE